MKHLILLLWVVITAERAMAQTHQDSLRVLEEQQQQLKEQEMALKARQDSIQKAYMALQKKENKERRKTYDPLYPNRTVIALHPVFLPTLGQIDVSLEQAVSPSSSLYIEFAYHHYNLRENGGFAQWAMPGDWIFYTGYRAELQYRYYMIPEERALYKLYVAPHFYYKQAEVSRGEGEHYPDKNGKKRQYEYYRQYQAEAIGFGGNMGCQFHIGEHVTFDPSVGFNYTKPVSGDSYSISLAHLWMVNPYLEGMSLRMNLSIGVSF